MWFVNSTLDHSLFPFSAEGSWAYLPTLRPLSLSSSQSRDANAWAMPQVARLLMLMSYVWNAHLPGTVPSLWQQSNVTGETQVQDITTISVTIPEVSVSYSPTGVAVNAISVRGERLLHRNDLWSNVSKPSNAGRWVFQLSRRCLGVRKLVTFTSALTPESMGNYSDNPKASLPEIAI